jgi:hypothetical protein
MGGLKVMCVLVVIVCNSVIRFLILEHVTLHLVTLVTELVVTCIHWNSNITIIILDIIHRPLFYLTHDVSEF